MNISINFTNISIYNISISPETVYIPIIFDGYIRYFNP